MYRKTKRSAANMRFGASGGVTPQNVLWGIERLYPAKTVSSPPPSPSRSTLCAIGRESGGQSCGSRENLNVTHDLKYNFF